MKTIKFRAKIKNEVIGNRYDNPEIFNQIC